MQRDEDRIKSGECESCSPSVRNKYFRGKLLTVADYEAEQRYMIRRRRLLNRSVLGWGVVSGFCVENEEGDLKIAPGIALDRVGRELVLCDQIRICSSEEILWLQEGACGCGETIAPEPGLYLLSAHYAERRIDGVRIDDGCGDASCEWNHICETVLFVLTPVKECPCGRPGCLAGCMAPSDCRLVETDCAPQSPTARDPKAQTQNAPHAQTDGGTGQAAPAEQLTEHAAAHDDRGPHSTLCDWNCDRLEGYDPCGKDRLCVQDGFWIDPQAGVPLACVTVAKDDCDKLIFKVECDCEPRRLVRSNDILFDLIRGCDLTRIQAVGWDDSTGEIATPNFYDMFVTPEASPQQSGQAAPGQQQQQQQRRRGGQLQQPQVQFPPVDTRFWICFTAPVQIASLTIDVMAVTLVQRDTNEKVGVVTRMPVEKLWILPTRPEDPPGTTRGFRPMVAWQFWDGEIKFGSASAFEKEEATLVEIEVRGDLILDWRGQAVDANRAGRHRWPTGNGTPGGTFLSSFMVQYPDQDDAAAAGGTAAAQAN